ncbi:MAG: hypothetical protein WCV81_00270 [Microgenomates group bacterium]
MFTGIIKIWGSSDKYFVIPVLVTIISSLLILSLFFIFYNHLPDKLPLFYSLAWGEGQLATKQQFLLLPIALILICLVNSLIASQLHSVQYLLKRMLMVSLIIIDLILVITAFQIVSIFI